MDSSKLNDWLQVVGLFGVLGGLIFVGLQLRQDRQIAMAEGVYNSVAFRQGWADAMGADAEVWVKGLAGVELSATELVQFEALADTWEVQLYSLWNRENLIGTEERAQGFARSAARAIHGSTGLLSYWHRHVERQTGTRDESPWEDAVNEELRLLGASLPNQTN